MDVAITPLTYGEVIRRYSDNVAKGYADTELNARTRRLVVVMLNLASNKVMYIPYATLRVEDRLSAVARLSDLMWDAGSLLRALTPSADADISLAHDYAVAILKGV